MCNHFILPNIFSLPTNVIAPKRQRKKIRNPNIEIRNKSKLSKPKAKNENPKRVGLEFCVFRSLGFVSNFGFRVASFFLPSHSLAPFAPLRESQFFRSRFHRPRISICQFEARQLDLRIMSLLEKHLDPVAQFYSFLRVPHQPALHDHALVQDHVDVVNRHLFFKRRIARHADQSEGVNLARPLGLDPIELPETIDASDAREELHLAAAFAFLQQQLASGGALPIGLIDFINFWQTLLRYSCFGHDYLLSITNAAVVPRLRP